MTSSGAFCGIRLVAVLVQGTQNVCTCAQHLGKDGWKAEVGWVSLSLHELSLSPTGLSSVQLDYIYVSFAS